MGAGKLSLPLPCSPGSLAVLVTAPQTSPGRTGGCVSRAARDAAIRLVRMCLLLLLLSEMMPHQTPVKNPAFQLIRLKVQQPFRSCDSHQRVSFGRQWCKHLFCKTDVYKKNKPSGLPPKHFYHWGFHSLNINTVCFVFFVYQTGKNLLLNQVTQTLPISETNP